MDERLPNLDDQLCWHLCLIAQRWSQIQGISPAARCFGMLHALTLLLEGKKAFPRCEITVGGARVTNAFSKSIEAIAEKRTISGELFENP